jgi:hypothetical protein
VGLLALTQNGEIVMDKLVRYTLAGFVANIIKDIPVIPTHIFFKIPKNPFWDYAGDIANGAIGVHNISDEIFSLYIEMFFGTAVGFIIAYILDKVNFKHKWFLAAGLGMSIWFLIRSSVWLFQLKEYLKEDVLSAIISSTLSIFFGLAVYYFENLFKGKSWNS